MARPKKPADKTRPHVVSFRLTDEEMARLEREAAALGTVPNECARLKTVGGRAPGKGKPAREAGRVLEVSFELRQELRRVGVNMNQIARRLNMTGEHEPEELAEASRRVEEIITQLLTGATGGVH
jgi:Bacterial mobilisation protein (MobC)